MKVKVCPKCGTQSLSSALKCMSCGEYLSAGTLKETDRGQFLSESRKEQNLKQDMTITVVNDNTVFGIGILVGFIGTAFNSYLVLGVSPCIEGIFLLGVFGSIFGWIGSVTGYKKMKSINGAWIGAIIGAMIIPSLCYFGFSSHILAF